MKVKVLIKYGTNLNLTYKTQSLETSQQKELNKETNKLTWLTDALRKMNKYKRKLTNRNKTHIKSNELKSKNKLSKSKKKHAYKALVRPKLEHLSSVWDSFVKSQVNQIEKVQRRAARFVTNRFHNTS